MDLQDDSFLLLENAGHGDKEGEKDQSSIDHTRCKGQRRAVLVLHRARKRRMEGNLED